MHPQTCPFTSKFSAFSLQFIATPPAHGSLSINFDPNSGSGSGYTPYRILGPVSLQKRWLMKTQKTTEKFMDKFSESTFRHFIPLPASKHGAWTPQKKNPERISPFIDEFNNGEEGLWSVIIPTYNRLPILTKCLKALEEQRDYQASGIREYEIIVVDDGSTDGTVQFLLDSEGGPYENSSYRWNYGRHPHGPGILSSKRFPHVKVLQQAHGGAARARNMGFSYSRGSVIVFIDSDLVVVNEFLKEHGRILYNCFQRHGDGRTFTYGRVINTNNFDNPQSEPFKLTDNSAAFFATGNVAITRRCLIEAANISGEPSEGPFDSSFSEYGWEDLELGVRLRQGGARIKHAPTAVGYHWHPSFNYDQLPMRIEQEKQRGRNGVRFYHKHPYFNVRLMIQMTPIHQILWFLLTLGGLLNEKTLAPLIKTLVGWGQPQLAEALISPILNWYTVQATSEEIRKLR